MNILGDLLGIGDERLNLLLLLCIRLRTKHSRTLRWSHTLIFHVSINHCLINPWCHLFFRVPQVPRNVFFSKCIDIMITFTYTLIFFFFNDLLLHLCIRCVLTINSSILNFFNFLLTCSVRCCSSRYQRLSLPSNHSSVKWVSVVLSCCCRFWVWRIRLFPIRPYNFKIVSVQGSA